ncbi:LLM class flavin-dependent oxidoreductase [Nonomuraea soli]|uniref:Putative F420-dependent oxidoreductase n=1 Tax=Nonomuraea soli TaxID=1032476 RepID=A0A7W0HU64_9ACTN|nr:LLM class flavin-dependent oxidoreductase [Nonomuraea soli]MBA2895868.1 putative F420-dependent oxidoreductase [Nonomuraea soli]
MPTPVISVQADPASAASWAELARHAEESGYAALLAPDHPGDGASPFVALASAAALTTRLELGTYVSHAGVREPLLLASDVATLDLLSGGRARLALGAGHTPAEWSMTGRTRPDVAGRVRRFLEVAEVTRALLAGETVTREGIAVEARLDSPRPVRLPVPFTFGGGNSTLLRWAGGHADVVGLTGLGRTLPDGHRHEVRWTGADVDRQVELVAEGAKDRPRPPELEALVQRVEITDDAEKLASELAPGLGMTVAEVLGCPYLWIGTVEEIVQAIDRDRERWGITRYVVRDDRLPAADRVLARLRG